MNNRRLATIFVIVFIDLLGFSLILPLLPYYAETFGADPFTTGLLVAAYAVTQLIGAPILGRLSDRVGRRPVLLISIFGTFTGFMLFGFANALWVLFASRLIQGLTGGNISVAQAYISDVTDEKNRANGLGMMGAAFGLGFIIGPAVGGTLSQWGYAAPSFIAAGLAFLNFIAVLVWLPESLTAQQRVASASRQRPPFTFAALRNALTRPRVGPLLQIRFFFGLAFAVLQSIFALYAQHHLGFTAQTTGYVLAFVGILSVFIQAVGVGWLTARFPENRLIFVGTLVMGAALLAWSVVGDLIGILVITTPIALAGGLLNTVLSSALTKSVYPEEIGGTLGLAASVESLTRVIAPIVGGFLLDRAGAWSPGVFCGIVMVWVVSFVWRRLIVNPDPPLPARAAPVPVETRGG